MNHPYRGYQPRIKWNRKQWSFLWIATDCIRKKKLNVSQKVSLLRVGEIDKGKTNDDVRNNKKDRKTRSVDWCVFQWVRWFAFSYLFLFFVYFQFSLSLSPSLPPSPPSLSLSLSLSNTHTQPLVLFLFLQPALEKGFHLTEKVSSIKPCRFSLRRILFIRLCRTRLFVPGATRYICTGDRAESISAFGFSVSVRWRTIKLDEDHAQWNGRVSVHRDQWRTTNSQQKDHRGRRMWVDLKIQRRDTPCVCAFVHRVTRI